MQYDLIIGIDPAGIGNNGIVIYSSETNNIIFNETFEAKTVLESKNLFKKYFLIIKQHFKNEKILVIVENFFLNSKQLLTNPLATPKIIGALMVLIQDVMDWDYQESEPKNKSNISNYQGNIILTKHEQDAYKHIQYYLRNSKTKDKANYIKLTVKLSNTIEAKYHEKVNKELYYTVRAQWNGLNYVTLIFNNPKFYKRFILGFSPFMYYF
ncbi:hypothetical protein [Spiroplasma endosymbiont of Virgichneumon dumeticola]|uniref:hypothetical protein n=1 Tax=Spiroplasma endosymbiont of Virgichneumon dumeticola TaxID=3139323 RepID=UPI0035C8B005